MVLLVPRVQRFAMLHLLEFHEKLLNALCQKMEGGATTEHAQSLILDILCWLAGVYSNVSWRYAAARCPGMSSPPQPSCV